MQCIEDIQLNLLYFHYDASCLFLILIKNDTELEKVFKPYFLTLIFIILNVYIKSRKLNVQLVSLL